MNKGLSLRKNLTISLVCCVSLTCGSQLENAITNLDGCKEIKAALDSVCLGDEAVGWLNCDYLPGCPGGKVEQESVRSCANKITVSPTCQAAKEAECNIVKLDCGSPAEAFSKPIGFSNACEKIITVLRKRSDDVCSSLQSPGDCARFLSGCTAGVFEDDDVEQCVTNAEKAPDCNAAISSAETCELRNKYCIP